ncbi:MAG TPA: hypothetical protein VFR03_06350 [Thermoanaerobaculia bacterium]|nr:hypothetical protein [Thermoanaerobaculia bacterium]
MTKSVMWKRVGIVAVALTVAGAGLFIAIPSSHAATSFPPKGTYNPCSGLKTHPIAIPGGPIFTSTTSGGIGVVVGDSFQTSDKRNGTTLVIQGLKSSGQVDGFGFVEIGIDQTRSAGPSTLVANQVGSDYPATQTMRFYPTVTVDGRPFQAMDVATLTNTAVTSTPPEIGTVYVLTNDVRMESPDNPGTVAFVIKPSKAFTVTGHNF